MRALSGGQLGFNLNARQVSLSCVRDGDANVDVVVTPDLPRDDTWTLHDRLGRHLGEIKRMPGGTFVADSKAELAKMSSLTFSSLDAVMSAIEQHMKGSCELASPDQGQT